MWFTIYKFLTSIFILLDIKYKYSRLQYKNIFYLFNDKLNYILAYYFIKLKIIKDNINKFLINLLIALFTKKLFYKNINE